MIRLDIDLKGAEAKSKSLKQALQPGRLLKIGSQAAAKEIRNHLAGLNSTRANRLGGRRTNFFAKASQAVSVQQQSNTVAIISISHVGIAQRYFGGLIRPIRSRLLTIPATAEAYGRRAREFPDLKVERTPKGLALVKPGAPGTPGVVMFFLARKVNQKADPTVLPSVDAMKAAAVKAVDSFLDREIAREAAPQ